MFSYFAAGQEQKKAILEQAARVPSTPSPAPVSPQAEKNVVRSTEPRAASEGNTPERRPRASPARSPRDIERPPDIQPAHEVSQPAAKTASSSSPPEGGGMRRTGSMPPRRPPPPSPPRLARAHSHAAPPQIPPRSTAANPRAPRPPPALPPRQLSAAADLNVSPRSTGVGSDAGSVRRAAPATFATTNPFAPRNTEFVIPQRNNMRRSSTTDRN